jgi:hypothetical protein
VLSLPLAIAIAEVRPVCFVVAGNEPATKCRSVIFGIAIAAAVPFIGVAEFIVTPIIEAAPSACIAPAVLESFLVAVGVSAPLKVSGVASVRISATVPVGCRARLSREEQTGHQNVRP